MDDEDLEEKPEVNTSLRTILETEQHTDLSTDRVQVDGNVTTVKNMDVIQTQNIKEELCDQSASTEGCCTHFDVRQQNLSHAIPDATIVCQLGEANGGQPDKPSDENATDMELDEAHCLFTELAGHLSHNHESLVLEQSDNNEDIQDRTQCRMSKTNRRTQMIKARFKEEKLKLEKRHEAILKKKNAEMEALKASYDIERKKMEDTILKLESEAQQLRQSKEKDSKELEAMADQLNKEKEDSETRLIMLKEKLNREFEKRILTEFGIAINLRKKLEEKEKKVRELQPKLDRVNQSLLGHMKACQQMKQEIVALHSLRKEEKQKMQELEKQVKNCELLKKQLADLRVFSEAEKQKMMRDHVLQLTRQHEDAEIHRRALQKSYTKDLRRFMGKVMHCLQAIERENVGEADETLEVTRRKSSSQTCMPGKIQFKPLWKTCLVGDNEENSEDSSSDHEKISEDSSSDEESDIAAVDMMQENVDVRHGEIGQDDVDMKQDNVDKGHCNKHLGQDNVGSRKNDVDSGQDNVGSRKNDVDFGQDNIGLRKICVDSEENNVDSGQDNVHSRKNNLGAGLDNVGSNKGNFDTGQDNEGSRKNNVGLRKKNVGSRKKILGRGQNSVVLTKKDVIAMQKLLRVRKVVLSTEPGKETFKCDLCRKELSSKVCLLLHKKLEGC